MMWYVALLRGVNVGGNKMVAMAELREMLTTLGFEDAKTLLQSGNAVFRGKAVPSAKLKTTLEAAIQKVRMIVDESRNHQPSGQF